MMAGTVLMTQHAVFVVGAIVFVVVGVVFVALRQQVGCVQEEGELGKGEMSIERRKRLVFRVWRGREIWVAGKDATVGEMNCLWRMRLAGWKGKNPRQRSSSRWCCLRVILRACL